MDYFIGSVGLGIGFLLVAVIALNASPGQAPSWARAPWLVAPAAALFLIAIAYYGYHVLFGP